MTPSTPNAPLDNLDVLQQVLSFVGQDQYLFTALTNKSFKTAYLEIFPENKRTCLNASTEECAKFCWAGIGTGTTNSIHTDIHSTQTALCTSAASHGSLPALQYLHATNCTWDEKTCEAAAKNGHLNVLQWLLENGCPWDEQTCAAAAENGHLNILQWCRENGCPWDEQTYYAAAMSGHLDVSQWCRENGCPYYKCTCRKSEFYTGHLYWYSHCKKW
jgi:hypothetical protein